LSLLALALLLSAPPALQAHKAKLDRFGCHHDRKAGSYHCHEGRLAGKTFASKEEMLRLSGEKAQPAGKRFEGKVVAVLDGDTLDVLEGGRAVRVRLYGVDCPEKSQAFGQKAKQFTSGLAFGKTVKVEVHDTDRYGRAVGEVFLGERSLNRELVFAGLAWWYQRYAADDAELERLEAEARAAKRGLWADKAPTAPWFFRAKSKPSA